MQDAAVAVGGLSALQRAHRALAFLSSAASDIAFADTTKERTFATLVSALEGLMPAQDASLERDTPPHQTQPAAFDADFPHLPHQTLSRPAHLPARPPAPMPAVAEHAQPATIRPAAASPDLETHDKLASQMVISVSSLSQPERESYNVPDATLTHLVQGALGSIQAVPKSARLSVSPATSSSRSALTPTPPPPPPRRRLGYVAFTPPSLSVRRCGPTASSSMPSPPASTRFTSEEQSRVWRSARLWRCGNSAAGRRERVRAQ
ncbi:hypothetical protein JCM11641_001764 [Rhodosporidiobolus odoratus]